MTTATNLDKVRETFNFSVDKFPLSGPENLSTPWYGLFRSDTGKPVGCGSVTDRYLPHQTDDVVALVEAASEAFDDDIQISCQFRNGHYVTCSPSRDYRKSIFGDKDNVFPRVIINAGYDGKSFNSIMGFYRDLCDNLSMLKQIEETSVTIRHTSGLRSKMDDLIATFNVLKDSWATLSNVIAELQGREVQMVEFLDAIYGQPDPDSKRGVTVHKNRTEAIFKRLQSERFRSNRPTMGSGFRVSSWEALNAIQGYVQHDATRKKNATAFDRMLLASRDQSVLKAQNLVLDTLAA